MYSTSSDSDEARPAAVEMRVALSISAAAGVTLFPFYPMTTHFVKVRHVIEYLEWCLLYNY